MVGIAVRLREPHAVRNQAGEFSLPMDPLLLVRMAHLVVRPLIVPDTATDVCETQEICKSGHALASGGLLCLLTQTGAHEEDDQHRPSPGERAGLRRRAGIKRLPVCNSCREEPRSRRHRDYPLLRLVARQRDREGGGRAHGEADRDAVRCVAADLGHLLRDGGVLDVRTWSDGKANAVVSVRRCCLRGGRRQKTNRQARTHVKTGRRCRRLVVLDPVRGGGREEARRIVRDVAHVVAEVEVVVIGPDRRPLRRRETDEVSSAVVVGATVVGATVAGAAH